MITPELKKAGNKLVWLRAPKISMIFRIMQQLWISTKIAQ